MRRLPLKYIHGGERGSNRSGEGSVLTIGKGTVGCYTFTPSLNLKKNKRRATGGVGCKDLQKAVAPLM